MNKTAILLLLLGIPLTLVTNLLTPTIKNWLALGSKKLIAQRIKVLESQVERLENPNSIDAVLTVLWWLFFTLMLLSAGLMAVTLALLGKPTASNYETKVEWMLKIGYLFFGTRNHAFDNRAC